MNQPTKIVMDLPNWKKIIEQARVGNTLRELNGSFGTNSGLRNDERFGKSLNEAILNLNSITLQVKFDYGNRSSHIVFWPNGATVYAFTKKHLHLLMQEYGSDFQLLTHNLHGGARHLFFYSANAKILISTTKSGSEPFGPMNVTRETAGILEYMRKRRSNLYRRWKHNFVDSDRFIDVNRTVSYTVVPVAQVKKLLGEGVTQLPIGI